MYHGSKRPPPPAIKASIPVSAAQMPATCTTEGACMDTDQSQRSAGSADSSMMSNGPGASAPEEPEPSMGETNPRSDDVDMMFNQ